MFDQADQQQFAGWANSLQVLHNEVRLICSLAADLLLVENSDRMRPLSDLIGIEGEMRKAFEQLGSDLQYESWQPQRFLSFQQGSPQNLGVGLDGLPDRMKVALDKAAIAFADYNARTVSAHFFYREESVWPYRGSHESFMADLNKLLPPAVSDEIVELCRAVVSSASQPDASPAFSESPPSVGFDDTPTKEFPVPVKPDATSPTQAPKIYGRPPEEQGRGLGA